MKLNLYRVNDKYCDYLRTFDKKVPFLMDEKQRRPFVGVVFSVNKHHFFAPLTSPKAKHLSMKNQVDFLKIDNGQLGAINFNNMIPVLKSMCSKIEINDMPAITKDQQNYKELIRNQLDWCNKNHEQIYKKAQKLYQLITTEHAPEALQIRCCNFSLLENKYYLYPQYLIQKQNQLLTEYEDDLER
ncbi:type III toxin-antitoxin system ToxN/AbiQ family toxin [Paludicola sp. MB14-C6]|uniref:type III toxin-antitoxin system ToxN/AbiQ family toxin n=1 Tax=Paludihabitans sp. MB14-C6 TaxID=3070656 RepID=UPI0027DC6E7F|nr:type III toxin-antitoxin system ToxN/AbiQ family toxin [Paludicola sp. MB14-C6]WMJ24288.1 type III toxin-antitoxin system ToxN/AbiQ family toxin [Paludicola sp. MB14-C6]